MGGEGWKVDVSSSNKEDMSLWGITGGIPKHLLQGSRWDPSEHVGV